jgi:hypothetical protein
MSNINTNSIDTNFPVPGVNNSSQGFRDNFASIKNNLSTASYEITDLQNKVVLKSALDGTSIDNNMGNTVISYAATRNFRSTLKDYGILATEPDAVIMDVSAADVHRGIIVGKTDIVFAGWAPAGTKNGVDLHLIVQADTDVANTYIAFQNSSYDSLGVVAKGMNPMIRNIENYSALNAATNQPLDITIDTDFAPGGVGITHTNSIGIPAGAKELHFRVTSEDCGTTMDIVPISRGHKAAQIAHRVPTGIGEPGDMPGAICVDGTRLYLCVNPYPAHVDNINKKSAAQWGSDSSTVLGNGIFGKETDTGKFKKGDGSSLWSALPYYVVWAMTPDNFFVAAPM